VIRGCGRRHPRASDEDADGKFRDERRRNVDMRDERTSPIPPRLLWILRGCCRRHTRASDEGADGKFFKHRQSNVDIAVCALSDYSFTGATIVDEDGTDTARQ